MREGASGVFAVLTGTNEPRWSSTTNRLPGLAAATAVRSVAKPPASFGGSVSGRSKSSQCVAATQRG